MSVVGLCFAKSIDFGIEEFLVGTGQEMCSNDLAVTPSFPYRLNKMNDPLLPYFHCFFLMYHYCSCLISILVSLQNYFRLFFVRSLP